MEEVLLSNFMLWLARIFLSRHLTSANGRRTQPLNMNTTVLKRAAAIIALCLALWQMANAAKCCEKVIFEISANGTTRKLSRILSTYTIDTLGSPLGGISNGGFRG